MRNFNISKPLEQGQTQRPIKKRKEDFQPFHAKVLAINLTNPEYGVGKIKFEPIERGSQVASVALPQSNGIKQLPLVGELVLIHPSPETGADLLYTLPANAQNNTTTNIVDGYYSQFFIEREDVNPLQPFNGDTLLEGRHGQSLRFSHFQDTQHSWGGTGDIGGAITVLSNGQEAVDDGRSYILENLDNDAAILALIENASIEFVDNSKRDSYQDPIAVGNAFVGNQAILSSDRIYLNAREDSLLLSAQSGSIGLSGNSINIDGVSAIGLDAPSYSLEADNFTTINQTRTIDTDNATYNYDQFNLNGTNIVIDHTRIALGANASHGLIQSTELMADVASLSANLTSLSNALTGVVALLAALPGGQAPAAALQTAAVNLTTQATSIQTKATSGAYLSTKAFTE